MPQNAPRAIQDVPPEWRDLHARWSEKAGDGGPPGATFEALDGGRTLTLASGEHVAGDSTWLRFRVRRAHPSQQLITPSHAPYVLAVRVFATDEDRDEFRRWLDQEHCRRQVALPDVRWFLGYEQVGPDHSFLNLWGIDDPEVVDGEAWTAARDTSWWKRISHVPANSGRGVYRRRSPSAE